MPAPWKVWKRMLSCKREHERSNGRDSNTAAPQVPKLSYSPSPILSPRRNSSSDLLTSYSSVLRGVAHSTSRVMHRADTGSPLTLEYAGSNPQTSPRGPVPSSPLPESHLVDSSKPVNLPKLSGCYGCTVASLPTDNVQQTESPLVGQMTAFRYSQTSCPKCGEIFSKAEGLEQHNVSQHTVTELKEKDSARNVVEIIFQTSWLKGLPCGKVEKILKVHNSPETTAKFEEYRTMVKAKATRLPRKHPRCVADGNELLRFHCTTFACALGTSGSSTLCSSPSCSVCRILRFGFPIKGYLGIYTTASSGKAHDSVIASPERDSIAFSSEKRAMLVCRVIAGRVRKIFQEEPPDESPTSIGFDSVAGESGPSTNLEELLVFNPKAVLPCFVVIYSV